MKENGRLFIVTNRLPVTVRDNGNDQAEITPASGGLITAVDSYLQSETCSFNEIF
jgi:trehalose-6-phosphate synthase